MGQKRFPALGNRHRRHGKEFEMEKKIVSRKNSEDEFGKNNSFPEKLRKTEESEYSGNQNPPKDLPEDAVVKVGRKSSD